MRIVVIGVLLIIAQVLQSTLFQLIRIGHIAPNLMIILIVSFALLRGSKEGTIVGIASGLIYDSTFGLMMGPATITYAFIGFLCGRFNKNFYRENFIIPLICTFFSSLFFNIVNMFALVLRGELHFIYYLKAIVVPELIYTMAIALLIYQMTYMINEKIEKGERKSRNMF